MRKKKKKRMIPMNTAGEHISKAILSGCYKFGFSTLLLWGGATMTYVLEVYAKDNNDKTMRLFRPYIILGSLQAHTSKQFVVDGYCPTIGCTDLSLPKLILVKEKK